MLVIPIFNYFLILDILDFCSIGFELFSEPEKNIFFILYLQINNI